MIRKVVLCLLLVTLSAVAVSAVTGVARMVTRTRVNLLAVQRPSVIAGEFEQKPFQMRFSFLVFETWPPLALVAQVKRMGARNISIWAPG